MSTVYNDYLQTPMNVTFEEYVDRRVARLEDRVSRFDDRLTNVQEIAEDRAQIIQDGRKAMRDKQRILHAVKRHIDDPTFDIAFLLTDYGYEPPIQDL